MDPGIYRNIPFAEYNRIEAVRASDLKNLDVSPKNHQWWQTHDKGSASMTKGEALHAAILEPDRFKREYATTTLVRNEKHEKYRAFLAAHEGMTILSRQEWQDVEDMASSARNHKDAMAILQRTDDRFERELTLIWKDHQTGLLCKARIDMIVQGSHWADIKTTKCETVAHFSTDFAHYRYDMQFAHYGDGLAANGFGALPCHCIALQNKPPFDCWPFLVTDRDVLHWGRQKCHAAMAKLALGKETGKWPGLVPTTEDLKLPLWATGEEGGIDFGDEVIS